MSAPAIDRLELAPPRARALLPRRVCLVTEAAGGGVGRHFLDLAEGLTARDIEVVAIYSPGRCDLSFRERRSSMPGIRFVELPMRRAVHPLDAFDLSGLIQCIRDEGPFDLIHGHSSKGGALARLAARWLGIPAIYTPHALVTLDPTLPGWKRRIYSGLERWLARNAAALIAVSDDEAAHARELGIDASKIEVVHNGIQPLPFPPPDEARERVGLAPDDLVIGFVGRLVLQKDPALLVRAFARVAQEHSGAKLVMVGDGPLAPAIRDEVGLSGLETRVLMLGDVAATPLMPAFDLLCLPSRYEGMPYVLLEALAAGLPIVATRVGGVTTCVEDGSNGFIVPPEDEGRLADALVKVAANRSLRDRFSTASASIGSRFCAARMVEETLAVYQRTLARRPAA